MRSMLYYHGVLLTLGALPMIGGCGTKESSSLPPAPVQWDEDGHDHAVHVHPTKGPHHGQLIELGNGEYHAELVHDEPSHLVGVYLLDSKATTAVPIAERELTVNLLVNGKPTQFQLAAAPLDRESDQHSSHFERYDQKLCEALELPDSKARFNVTIQGRHFVAYIESHKHDRVAQKKR
jgi:hypothetical protein